MSANCIFGRIKPLKKKLNKSYQYNPHTGKKDIIMDIYCFLEKGAYLLETLWLGLTKRVAHICTS